MELTDRSLRDSLIVDSISDMIWEMDLKTKEVQVSDSWKEFLGYEEDSYKDYINLWHVIVHPEDIENVNKVMIEHIEDKTPIYSVKYRIKTKNKGYKWVLSRGKVYRNNKNEAVYIAGFHIDISAHVSLSENEEKYRNLFNSVKDSIFLVKVDKNTLEDEFIEVNDAAAELLGCTKAELIGKSANDLKPKNFHSQSIVNKKKALNNENCFFQTTLISKTKGLIPVEISISDLHKNGEHLYLSVVRDISERVNAEKALKEERERNRNIVNLSPNGAIMHDNGKIVYANKKGIELLKAKNMEELVGKNYLDFLTYDFIETAKERLKRVQSGDYIGPIEVIVNRLDGSTIFGEVSSTYMPSESGTLALSYINDITALKNVNEENKKLLEQTLEYDKLKTEFFANISHELRTPLNIILSSIQLLNLTNNQCSDKKEQCFIYLNKYIEVMKQNSYRLLKLVNNLIDITRIDKGFYNINLKNNNIVQIIEDVTLSVVPYVENRGMELIFDTDFEEKIVACDEDKIERILLNLLSNAIKFTGKGGRIKVNIGQREGKLIISVRDTGRGIPKDKYDLIFERFRQVDEVLTKRAEGSGIGLSIVKALVTAHEGQIKVESEIGKGSEFLIELPIRIIEDEGISNITTDISNLEQNKIDRINIELADIDL